MLAACSCWQQPHETGLPDPSGRSIANRAGRRTTSARGQFGSGAPEAAAHLLFLGAVGLHRTWDLRGYTADGLALLTGRKRAYGYRYTEAFLSQVAHAGGAERLTDASGPLDDAPLASLRGSSLSSPTALTCYIDGHRKPVYSDVLIPRGLVGRSGSDPGMPSVWCCCTMSRAILCLPPRIVGISI